MQIIYKLLLIYIAGHVGTQLLRYPHLLRRLRVVNSKISVENLHYLLLDSATTLRHLDLNLAPPVTTSPTELGLSPDKFSYKFKNVTHLSLSISTVPSATEEAVHFVEAQVMRGPPMAIQVFIKELNYCFKKHMYIYYVSDTIFWWIIGAGRRHTYSSPFIKI